MKTYTMQNIAISAAIALCFCGVVWLDNYAPSLPDIAPMCDSMLETLYSLTH